MQLFIKILPDDEKKWFPMECEVCGWIGSSEHSAGGGQIADTGDYDDPLCPCCFSRNVDETDNDQPATSWIDRLKKATSLVKKLTEKVEGCDCSKHIYSHFEEQNKQLQSQLTALQQEIGAFAEWASKRGWFYSDVQEKWISEACNAGKTTSDLLTIFQRETKGGQCDHCGGTGFDPHPNHSTSYPVCPKCEGKK